jgi:hypothetical protein
MGRKSELADLVRRIQEINERLHSIGANSRQANDPVVRPLRLELRVATAKRDLIRAERRQSKHLLKQAQLKFDLAQQEQQQARTLFPLEERAAAGPTI